MRGRGWRWNNENKTDMQAWDWTTYTHNRLFCATVKSKNGVIQLIKRGCLDRKRFICEGTCKTGSLFVIVGLTEKNLASHKINLVKKNYES